MHRNPGLEIVYVSEGSLTWRCENQIENVRSNSLYFTLPGQMHGSVFDFEPHHRWYFTVLRLNDSGDFWLPRELGFTHEQAAQLFETFSTSEAHCFECDSLTGSILPSLVAELETPSEFFNRRVTALTSELLLGLYRLIQSRPAIADHSAGHRARIDKLLLELEKRLDEPWSLDSLADFVDLKRTRFTEIFKEKTGDTPLRYLNRLRLRKARKLLRETDEEITTIAYSCGYASSQRFALAFRKMTGVSASVYRRFGLPEVQLPRRK